MANNRLEEILAELAEFDPESEEMEQENANTAPRPNPRGGGGRKKKRKREKKVPKEYPPPLKMPKKHSGYLYTFGTNCSGQVGTANQVEPFPVQVTSMENVKIKQVACGEKHTLVLDKAGQVWSFGSNEKKVLGRKTNSKDEEKTPGIVPLPKKVKMISAGDSHSVALTTDGEVYAWGCYLAGEEEKQNHAVNAYDPIYRDLEFCEDPYFITSHLAKEHDDVKIIKIVSGANHIAMLGDDSRLYTCGAWDQGQLSRYQPPVPRMQTRSDPDDFLPEIVFSLRPEQCVIGHKYNVRNVWATRIATFCFAGEAGQIYVSGNNLYSQLGIRLIRWDPSTKMPFHPTKKNAFNTGEPGNHRWKQIVGGDHHTIGLTEDGKVYAIGCYTKGRLGLGEEHIQEIRRRRWLRGEHVEEILEPIPELASKTCVQIAAGIDNGYALTIDGELYSWGEGKRNQLAHDDGVAVKEVPTFCKVVQDRLGDLREISRISIGMSHVALVISTKSTNVHDEQDEEAVMTDDEGASRVNNHEPEPVDVNNKK